MRLQSVSSANNWWECSPNSGNSNNFCNVNNNGNANNNNASNTNGLSPFGCIEKTRKVARVKLDVYDTGDCGRAYGRIIIHGCHAYEHRQTDRGYNA